MKNRLLLIIIKLFFGNILVAQSDTSIVVNTNHENTTKEKFWFLYTSLKDEKRLLKLGISPANALETGKGYTIAHIGIYAGYEKKLIPSLSIISGISYATQYRGSYYHRNNTGIGIGTRYYYNINRKIKQGTSANNFHNSYIGLEVEYSIQNYNLGNSVKATTSQTKLYLSWGIQKRFKKHGYIDFAPYVSYEIKKSRLKESNSFDPLGYTDVFDVGAKLTLGFAWGK